MRESVNDKIKEMIDSELSAIDDMLIELQGAVRQGELSASEICDEITKIRNKLY